MTSVFAPKTQLMTVPLPMPTIPTETPVYPQNLASIAPSALVLLLTQYTILVAHSTCESAKIEAESLRVKEEMDREVTLRFVHNDSKSTTERKERAKASKKVMALSSSLSLIMQDLVVLRALVDSYKTCLFSVKSEIERRKYE